MRRSVTGELALAAAAQQLAETTTAAPSTEPKTRKWTNDEVIAKLETAPSQQRVPGRTLLKGHTFFAEGANMKIWNATARWGPQGPFMEVRKGVIVQQQFPDLRPIKLVAWGY